MSPLGRIAPIGVLVVGLGAGLETPGEAVAQQRPDTTFTPQIAEAAFAPGEGPTVAIDAAHLNFHTADGGFQAFARLLRRAGYSVVSNEAPFTDGSLEGIDVLVVANAMHAQSEMDWAPLPNLSAFSDAEVRAVERWVREGGALLLIADHMPLAGHAEGLAAAFGLRFYNGFALDAESRGRITFRRSDGSLAASVPTDGRTAAERVDSVTTFTGQAFRVDPGVDAEAVLVLPEGYTVLLPPVAWEFSEATPRVPAAHLLQGVVLRHGRGRVAAFGEAAMFTAQLAGPNQTPVGMNDPAAGQNYRLVLNTLRWLSAASP